MSIATIAAVALETLSKIQAGSISAESYRAAIIDAMLTPRFSATRGAATDLR